MNKLDMNYIQFNEYILKKLKLKGKIDLFMNSSCRTKINKLSSLKRIIKEVNKYYPNTFINQSRTHYWIDIMVKNNLLTFHL